MFTVATLYHIEVLRWQDVAVTTIVGHPKGALKQGKTSTNGDQHHRNKARHELPNQAAATSTKRQEGRSKESSAQPHPWATLFMVPAFYDSRSSVPGCKGHSRLFEQIDSYKPVSRAGPCTSPIEQSTSLVPAQLGVRMALGAGICNHAMRSGSARCSTSASCMPERLPTAALSEHQHTNLQCADDAVDGGVAKGPKQECTKNMIRIRAAIRTVTQCQLRHRTEAA